MDTMEPQEPQVSEEKPNFADTKKGNIAPILGIIVIIILLALGGLYYFTQGIEQIPDYADSAEGELQAAENEADAMRAQSDSTDLADIEADVEATDLTGLEEASADFDSELDAQ